MEYNIFVARPNCALEFWQARKTCFHARKFLSTIYLYNFHSFNNKIHVSGYHPLVRGIFSMFFRDGMGRFKRSSVNFATLRHGWI